MPGNKEAPLWGFGRYKEGKSNREGPNIENVINKIIPLCRETRGRNR